MDLRIIYLWKYNCRRIGKTFIPHEGAGWFPEEDLREHYGLQKGHNIPKNEKTLFGYRDDGSEGIVLPTFPRIATALSMTDPEEATQNLDENTCLRDANKPTRDLLSPSDPVFSISTIHEDN